MAITHIGRIKIIKEDEDEMLCICICPHCGNKELYGNMFTISGIHGCPNCQTELLNTINYDRVNQYDVYARKANNHEYEPYRYKETEK